MLERVDRMCFEGLLDEAEATIGDELRGRSAAADRFVLLTQRARIRAYRSRHPEAWADFAAAQEYAAAARDDDRIRFHDARGMFALDLGRVDQAARDFAHRSRASDDSTARLNATMLAFATENFAAAESGARELAANGGSRIDAGMMVAMAAMASYRLAGRGAEARDAVLAEFEVALRKSQQSSVHIAVHLASARMALDHDDVAAAEAAVGKALAVPGGPNEEDQRDLAVLRSWIALRRDAAPDVLQKHSSELRELLRQQRQKWLALPPQPGGVGFLQFAAHRDPLSIAIALERRLHPEAADAGLDLLLELEAVSTMARRLDAGTATLARLRSTVIPPDGGVLFVLPALSVSWAILITATDIHVQTFDRVDEAKATARAIRADLVDNDPATRSERLGRIRTHGQRLADILLPEPLRTRVNALRHLVIAGGSLLNDPPFEVLPGPKGGWLGAELAISYVPSFASAIAIAERAAEGSKTARSEVMLFAANRPAPSAAPPTSNVAAFAIGDFATTLPAGTTAASVIVGDGATAAAFAAAAKPTTFACIVGHGIEVEPQSDDDRASALALAGEPGAALCCRDVEAARLDVSCAFLAACGGARGQHRIGDDAANHLAGAFLQGGAAAVVAGDLDLELAATLQAATAMRTAFADGCCAAEALRRARCEALATPDAEPSAVFALHAYGAAALPIRLSPVPTAGGWLRIGSLLAAAAAILAAAALRRRHRV